MSKKVKLLFLMIFIISAAQAQVYKDPKAPVAARVKDLLSRMTLEEKVGQMTASDLDKPLNGNIAYGVCASPFVFVTDIAKQSAAAKRASRENSRLGIPIIQIGECLHGQLAAGATIFPQAIAQGCTFDPALIKQMGSVIAYEASSSGVDQALSPLFDIIRDPRYGRVEECYSEDPYLVSMMGTAFVTGMQGDARQSRMGIGPGKVMCTAKHFAAYSLTTAGINLSPAEIGERELRSMVLPPFKAAVQQANIYSVMPAYNEIDGIPAHANNFLLDHILRKEWGFKGYVFSDYEGLSMLYYFHKIAKDAPAAAIMGIKAGVDLESPEPNTYPELIKLVRSGAVKESMIDTAVARILTAKFKAGLFEKPLPDTLQVKARVHTPEHIALSQQIAEESIILLKNDKQLLPLNINNLRSLAVIGPNAGQVQYGDYSPTRDNRSGTTVLQGIKEFVGDKVNINYAKGCDLSSMDKSGFGQAIIAAKKSDAVVVVLGTTSVVFSGVGWNGHTPENEPKDPFTCGEGYDVTDINPQGVQRELLQELYKTGKPIILVLIHGRPWSISWEKENLPAILEAWYPGEKGGTAIANILFGKVNPSGRLNVSIPQSTGHIPVYYNMVNSNKGFYHDPGTPDKPGQDYVFSSTAPLFPFGFGLSYTSFEYSNLKVSADQFTANQKVEVSVDVKNTGPVIGKEVVQLYLGNKVNSVSTPVMALEGFNKVELHPGETKTITFTITPDDIAIWNTEMKYVTEPGPFDVMIGRSAEDVVLKKTIEFKYMNRKEIQIPLRGGGAKGRAAAGVGYASGRNTPLHPSQEGNRTGPGFALFLFLIASFSIAHAQTYTKYVNPFIGTAATGHTFPGATVPFGMVQLSPETGNFGWDYCSGYRYEDSVITGFAHTHLNGTGGIDLGDVLFFPFQGKAPAHFQSKFLRSTEKASPGYYTVVLSRDNIKAELTASRHNGLHRYTFNNAGTAHILVDIQSSLVDAKEELGSHVLAGHITVTGHNTISGYTSTTEWVDRRMFFIAKFKRPFTGYHFIDGKIHRRLVLDFANKPGEQVAATVAISAVSVAGAALNLSETAHGSFDEVKTEASNAWEKQLECVKAEGTTDQLISLYTSLYHLFIQPNNIADLDGKYRGPDGKVHQSPDKVYYSTFSLWDTFRAAHPMYTILCPNRDGQMVETMLQHFAITHALPIWTLWGKESYAMIANHSIPVIVDAALKGIEGFDKEQAFTAIKYTLTHNVNPKYNWNLYIHYGYLPSDSVPREAVSRTLEACYDDWCAAQLARSLHKLADYDYFIKRSLFYKNVFDRSTNLMRGKLANGSWVKPFANLDSGQLAVGGDYTEGNAWQYVWQVQHNIPGLIEMMGGNKVFSDKLDSLFTMSSATFGKGSTVDVTGLIGQYAHGNEPVHHVAYLYTLAGNPAATQLRVRQICDEFYQNKPGGLSGNDDCGQMSAWDIFTIMGFYPVNPADGHFVFGAPQIKRLAIALPGNKQFVIKANNLSIANKFVKSISLNGKVYDKPYIIYADIMAGGELVFNMTDMPMPARF